MDRLAATLLLLPGLLACAAPKEVAPEDLVETFETSATASEVQEAAVGVLRAEHFRALDVDGQVVRAEREHCRTVQSGGMRGTLRESCSIQTFATITVRDSESGTRVTVQTSPRMRSRSSEDVHWCKTITAKLKEALGVERE